jgi:DNA repair exonuclease SbcCD ATPase subunit
MAVPKGPILKDSTPLTEQFFVQVQESIQAVFDLTSRIDERVKILIEHQKEIDSQIDKVIEMQQSCIQRLNLLEAQDYDLIAQDLHEISKKIAVIQSDKPEKELQNLKSDNQELNKKIHSLELKLEATNYKVGSQENRWIRIFDSLWKILLMIIASYILYKLGLQGKP